MKYCRLNSSDESKGVTDFSNDRHYLCWKKWMEIGQRTGCHQRADRSFYIKGFQMPVCARCTGVILGYLAAIPGFFLLGYSKLISLLGGIVLFADWLLQEAGWKESTNRRRLITGIMGGYSIMSIQLFLIKKAVRFFLRTHK